MSSDKHTHKLTHVAYVPGEFGGTYELRWCVECGALYEFFGNKIAEILPESALQHQGSKARLVPQQVVRRTKKSNVLGRRLRDLMVGPWMRKLPGQ